MGSEGTPDGNPPRRLRAWAIPLACTGLTVLLYTLAFAPWNRFESAFVCLTPYIGWAMFRPRLRPYVLASFATALLCWVSSLSWLLNLGEHLGGWQIGLFCLGGCALILCWGIWIWLLLLHRVIPSIMDRSLHIRLLGMGSLAGAWVLLEWAREHLRTQLHENEGITVVDRLINGLCCFVWGCR